MTTKKMCTWRYIAGLFVVIKVETTQIAIKEYKILYNYAMEYYSAIKNMKYWLILHNTYKPWKHYAK